MIVLAIDPGSKKSGIALVSSEEGILRHTIVPVAEVAGVCLNYCRETAVDEIIIGGSTGSKKVRQTVEDMLQRQVTVVDERHTTELAKRRYFAANPPRGWRRLLPQGLLYPPVPFDDYAAVVMAEAFIAGQDGEAEKS